MTTGQCPGYFEREVQETIEKNGPTFRECYCALCGQRVKATFKDGGWVPVWSEPLKTLCSRFGISDVIAEEDMCRSIMPIFQVALPICPPGMDDQVPHRRRSKLLVPGLTRDFA